jgi:hypothetical protein
MRCDKKAKSATKNRLRNWEKSPIKASKEQSQESVQKSAQKKRYESIRQKSIRKEFAPPFLTNLF